MLHHAWGQNGCLSQLDKILGPGTCAGTSYLHNEVSHFEAHGISTFHTSPQKAQKGMFRFRVCRRVDDGSVGGWSARTKKPN